MKSKLYENFGKKKWFPALGYFLRFVWEKYPKYCGIVSEVLCLVFVNFESLLIKTNNMMKKSTLFLCLCVFLCFIGTVYAQETIELNFKDRKFEDLKKIDLIKKGDFFKIKISNLNTYLYKVEVTSEDSTITTSLPKNLFAVLDLTNLNTLAATLPQTIRGLVKAEKDSLGEKGFMALETTDINMFVTITTNLLESKKVLITHQKVYNEIQTSILEYMISVQTEEKEALFPLPTKENMIAIQTKLKELNAAVYENHISLNESYKVFVKKFNKLSTEDKTKYKEAKAKIDALYTELDKKYTELVGFTSATSLKTVWENIIVVYNNKSFIYESLPIQRTGDLSEVTIKITPRDSTTRLHAYTTKFTFATEVEPWSVSSGFYITGNPDEDFSAKAVTDSNGMTTYDLIEEENGDYEVGLNVMIRYNWRLAGKQETFWHVGIGTGVNVGPKIRPRVFLGTGLAFGNKNKFIIDVGGVYMFYDKISSAVDLTGNTSIPENYTVSASKIQPYFSLGYTISLN